MTAEKPPRRKRYRGTHPRRFSEKYKELHPERFPTEAAKVIARGQTPAGSHIPILLAESLAALDPRPGETALDCTLGYGAHAAAVGERIGAAGRLLGIDLDQEELARTTARLKARGIALSPHHTNFAGLGAVLTAEGIEGVDMLLADLGVSSMQLDRPERGFSFKTDGPLDMRMDRSRGVPASQWLEKAGEEDLARLLADYGDEPDAAAIARALVESTRAGRVPKRTQELVALITEAKGLGKGRPTKSSAFSAHPAARVFQALRMAVNREPANLDALLRALPYALKPGGRAALITFHSGEDRRVAEAFARGRAEGIYAQGNEDPARPSSNEVRLNPRARSARLHRVTRL